MTVFAVIPTHNRCEILARCLAALTSQSLPPTIIVGDAGSTDGTAKVIQDRFPQVVTRRGCSELWWTGATNLALREALNRCESDDFILCLNDDTEVAPDYLETLLAAAGKGKRLVGSVSVAAGAGDIIIDGGNRLNWYTAAFHRLNKGRRLSEFPKGHEEAVDVLPGRGTLIPAMAFIEHGMFAERELPHYAADYEFSARCAKAGYRLVVSYDAIVHSRTDLTGTHTFRTGFSLRELRHVFLARRSSTNIKDRFYFAWLTRRTWQQAMLFFVLSMGRIAGHHAVNLILKNHSKTANPR